MNSAPPKLIRRQKKSRRSEEETKATEDRTDRGTYSASSPVNDDDDDEENDRTKDERRSSPSAAAAAAAAAAAPQVYPQQASEELLPLNGNGRRTLQCACKEVNESGNGRSNQTSSSSVLIRAETSDLCPLSSEASIYDRPPSSTQSNSPQPNGRGSSMKVTAKVKVKDNSFADEREGEEASTTFLLPSKRMQEKRSKGEEEEEEEEVEEEAADVLHSNQSKKTISIEDESTAIDERRSSPFRTTEDRKTNFPQNNGHPAAETTEVAEALADDVMTAKQTGNRNPLTCIKRRKKISSKDRSFTSFDGDEKSERLMGGREEKNSSETKEESSSGFKAKKTLSSSDGKPLQNCSGLPSDRHGNISMFNFENANYSSEETKFPREFPLLESNSRLSDDEGREGKDRLEKTHMTRDEVWREAQRQGLLLYNSVPNSPLDSADDLPCEDSPHQQTTSPVKAGKETKRPSGGGRRQKGSVFNLRTWLDKLTLSSGAEKSSLPPRRRQYVSYSSSSSSSGGGRSARTLALAPCQRRSLSASSNPRNRKSSGNLVVNDDGDDVIDSSERSDIRFFHASSTTKSATIGRRSKVISASGSLGSTTSCQSMIVSPSTGSLCSVFSHDGGGDNEQQQHSNDNNNTVNDLSGSASSPSPLVTSHDSPSLAMTTTSGGNASVAPPEKDGKELRSNMDQLKECDWYWGAVDWKKASRLLADASDGTFLLRDSLDDRYLFSLSFKSQGAVHHSRIQYYKGTFSFVSHENPFPSSSVLELMRKGVMHCRLHPYVYCLTPRPPSLLPVPVRLLFPLRRSASPASLLALCQELIGPNPHEY